jgi:hypothetical protein
MGNLDPYIIELEPLGTFETSLFYDVAISMIQNMIYALKPGIGNIPSHNGNAL